jgi:excisionase family DNA binding protein
MDQAAPIVADDADAIIARKAFDNLSLAGQAGEPVRLVVRERADIVIPLPARAVSLILSILKAMADQQPVSVIPHEAELTTQQAADFLNVSRPYLVERVDRGDIPHRKAGRHRRIRFADLLAYERQQKEVQLQALGELAAEASRLGLE